MNDIQEWDERELEEDDLAKPRLGKSIRDVLPKNATSTPAKSTPGKNVDENVKTPSKSTPNTTFRRRNRKSGGNKNKKNNTGDGGTGTIPEDRPSPTPTKESSKGILAESLLTPRDESKTKKARSSFSSEQEVNSSERVTPKSMRTPDYRIRTSRRSSKNSDWQSSPVEANSPDEFNSSRGTTKRSSVHSSGSRGSRRLYHNNEDERRLSLHEHDDWDGIDPELLMVEFTDLEGAADANEPKKIGIQTAVEKVILALLSPAIDGIPRMGIPSATVRAKQLLSEKPMNNFDHTENCVREVIAGSEAKTSTLLVDFFLDKIPFLGCPTVLARNAWGELRGISIIAALYGHDLKNTRVQHEILLCLIPQQNNDASDPSKVVDLKIMSQNEGVLLSETAGKVAKTMVKAAVSRATGMWVAADCIELASQLFGLYDPKKNLMQDEDGFVHVVNTPTATARAYFRPKLMKHKFVSRLYVPALLLGCISPQLNNLISFLSRYFAFVTTWWFFVTVLMTLISGIFGGLFYLKRVKQCENVYLFLQIEVKEALFKVAAYKLNVINRLPKWWLTTAIFLVYALLPCQSAYSSLQHTGKLLTVEQVSFHEFAYFCLGTTNFFHLLLKRIQFETWNPLRAQKVIRALVLFRRFALSATITVSALYTMLVLEYIMTYKILHWKSPAFLAYFWFHVKTDEADHLGMMAEAPAPAPDHYFDEEDSMFAENNYASLHSADYVTPAEEQTQIVFYALLISAKHFYFSSLAAYCNHTFLDILKKRDFLLHLIGAEKLMANTLCLLLNGVAIVNNLNLNIADFLESISPPSLVCCAIVALREKALQLGILLALFPLVDRMLFAPFVQTAGSFWCGVGMGGFMMMFIAKQVALYFRALEDSYAVRIAYLIPGEVSDKAVEYLNNMVGRTRRKAMQYVAVGFLERVFRWFMNRRV